MCVFVYVGIYLFIPCESIATCFHEIHLTCFFVVVVFVCLL